MFPVKTLAALGCILLVGLALADNDPELTIKPGADGKQVEVTAILPPAVAQMVPDGKLGQEQGEQLLQMFLVDGGKAGPPMLGSYARQGTTLTFGPRFPLEAGQLYRVKLTLPKSKVVMAEYRAPEHEKGPPAVVTKIYPNADVLPANHLKWYIHFSRPMRGGEEIFNQFEILDDKGNPVFDPWLMDELWNEDGTILILYIQPGRIKWGVILRELFGPVLYPNREYTLRISGDMLDDRGQKLGKDFVKKFKTTAEDRVRVELSDWKLTAPAANSKAPLLVQFPKLIDHKSLERYLSVIGPDGNDVAGKAVVAADQKSWSLHPAQPWQAAEYTLKVHGKLEDVAGNNPLRPFDLDLKSAQPPPQKLQLTFRPALAK